MSKITNLAAVVAGAALAVLPAFPQELNRSEISVQAFGSFVMSTTNNGIRQSATDSGGVLANYRFFFTPDNGLEVNYGYSLNTQTLSLPSGPLGTKAGQHEATAAYVLRHKFGEITPFVEAGVGALVFDPQDVASASSQTRAAFVYGGGADFNITSRLFLRAEYRGFVYNSSTFDLVAAQDTDRITHRAEPSVGFGYRF